MVDLGSGPTSCLAIFVLLVSTLYVCVTQRFELFKEKRYINIYHYYYVDYHNVIHLMKFDYTKAIFVQDFLQFLKNSLPEWICPRFIDATVQEDITSSI